MPIASSSPPVLDDPDPWACHTIANVGVHQSLVGVFAELRTEPDSEVLRGISVAQHDRVRAAVAGSGWSWPDSALWFGRSTTVGELGSSSDLAIALSVLVATGQAVTWPGLSHTLVLGELGSDGSIRACRGVYPAVAEAKSRGLRRVIVPEANLAEASLVDGITIAAVGESLQLVNAWLAHATATVADVPFQRPFLVSADAETSTIVVEAVSGTPADPTDPPWPQEPGAPMVSLTPGDLAEIPAHVLRAAAVAAAGGHHMILTHDLELSASDVGAFLVSLLPPLPDPDRELSLAIGSLAGDFDPAMSAPVAGLPDLVAVLPGCDPENLYGQRKHHPARPGYMPLAHAGLLHLVDANAFAHYALDVVAQTMTTGSVWLAGNGAGHRFPARFQLLATMLSCPRHKLTCTCTPQARREQVTHVHRALAGHIAITITAPDPSESTTLRVVPTPDQVATARIRAARRWGSGPHGPHTNQTVPFERLTEGLGTGVEREVAEYTGSGLLPAESFYMVLRLMWAIADLDGHTSPGEDQFAEALGLYGNPTAHY